MGLEYQGVENGELQEKGGIGGSSKKEDEADAENRGLGCDRPKKHLKSVKSRIQM